MAKNQISDKYKIIYELLKKEKFNKRLDKLIKKFKNKKVLIYGAGLLSKIIFENYDTNLFNIIGVMDKKFSDSNENFYGYNTYTPDNINNIDFDVIFVFSLSSYEIINDLLLRINKQTPIQIEPAIATNLKEQISYNFGKITNYKLSDITLNHYDIPNVVKEYADFPKWMPNVFMANHGWATHFTPLFPELQSNKELMLVINKKTKKYWEEDGNKKVVVFGLHYIHYRRRKKIKKSPDSKGTIVCPAHGTTNIYMDFDIDDFCSKLKELPPEFHPITICLGIHDIELWKKDIEFKKHGFELVTAGSPMNKEFIDNLYEILGKHNYCVSNSLTTVAILTLELGLPFFLLGEKDLKMKKVQKKDSEYLFTEEFAYNEFPLCYDEQYFKLFQTGPIDKITPEQKLFLDEEAGLKDCISPKELNALLWSTFIKYELKKYVNEFLRMYFYKQNKLDIKKTNIELYCPNQLKKVKSLDIFSIPITIYNKGTEKLISSLPYPIYVSYRWLKENGEIIIPHGEKTAIKKPIFHGQSSVINTIVRTPRIKGDYILQITLLQDTCFWFEKSLEKFSPINLKVNIS